MRRGAGSDRGDAGVARHSRGLLEGAGFRVWGLGLGFWGLGLRVWVWGLGFRVSGMEGARRGQGRVPPEFDLVKLEQEPEPRVSPDRGFGV